jgi:hypothetical protein
MFVAGFTDGVRSESGKRIAPTGHYTNRAGESCPNALKGAPKFGRLSHS